MRGALKIVGKLQQETLGHSHDLEYGDQAMESNP